MMKPAGCKYIKSIKNPAFSVSALLSSPPLYGWAQYSYIQMQHFCFCDWTKDKGYAFFMIGACFGVPFTVMLFCSIMIFRRVRDSQMKVLPELPVSTATWQALEQAQHSLDSKLEKGIYTNPSKSNQRYEVSVCSRAVQVKNGKPKSDQSFPRESPLNRDNIQKDYSETVSHGEPNYDQTNGIIKDAKTFSVKSRTRRNDAQEMHLTVTLTVVLVIFFICWFPYCISVMLSIFYVEGVPRSFYVFTLMIAYFNTCCNPVIYGVMNKQFRAKFKQLFCSCKRNKNKNPVK
ncbi:hypothetical protein CHS0354_011291 [Potamilus streckersoni]|uniref:G-protein coupled receptors family 1 profile domain-containing protein n=1 Tax=Potamilus streckersoni TaxID=2493646 RepID=A0AAE0VRB1_9BIVA|nr:hypothetical protein CHS0354_011291 [Potamilus streckersoni]